MPKHNQHNTIGKTQKSGIICLLRTGVYTCLYAVLGVIILLSLSVFVQSKRNPQSLPKMFNKKFFTVQTEKAKNIALSGDFVVIDCVSHENLSVGDNVAVQTSQGVVLGILKSRILYNGANSFVIETANRDGNIFMRIVHSNNIEGRVEYKIKILGNLAMIVQHYYFVIVIFEVILLCAVLWDIFSNVKPKPNFL